MYNLYTDGSQIFEAKRAGIGGYITDESGKTVGSFDEDISDESYINFHETLALKQGLKMAIDLGIKEIKCYMDDQGLSNILLNRDISKKEKYESNNPYLKEIFSLVEHFSVIEVEHVVREYNKKADKLSKKYIETYLQEKKDFREKVLLNGVIEDKENPFLKTYDGQYYAVTSNVFNSQNNPGETSLYKQFGKDSLILWLDCFKDAEGFHLSIYVNEEENKKLHAVKIIKNDFALNGLKFIAEEMKGFDNKNIWLDLNKLLRGYFEGMFDIIMNVKPINKKHYGAIEKVLKVFNQFDRVVIANTPERGMLESNPINKSVTHKKVKVKRDKTKEYLSAMKILGDNLYIYGTDPELEERFKVLPEKKGDLSEIQKKYFNCYTDVKIKNYIVENNKEITPAEKEKIENETKQELITKGIRLRF